MKENIELIDWALVNVIIAAADTMILTVQSDSKLIKFENDLPYELNDLQARIAEFQETGVLDVNKLRVNISSVLTAMNGSLVE